MIESKRKAVVADPVRHRWKETIMNTQPLEKITNVEQIVTETEALEQNGFSQDEVISLLWLRQWYQNGGSDRMEVVRYLEFLKYLVMHNKIEL